METQCPVHFQTMIVTPSKRRTRRILNHGRAALECQRASIARHVFGRSLVKAVQRDY